MKISIGVRLLICIENTPIKGGRNEHGFFFIYSQYLFTLLFQNEAIVLLLNIFVFDVCLL